MKTWYVIVIGAGIIGLSLAVSLRKQGLRVLVVERGEPGREASFAAAGMLAPSGKEIPGALKPLAEASSQLYPEFVHELEDESGLKIDFNDHGAVLLSSADCFPDGARILAHEEALEIEGALSLDRLADQRISAAFVPERLVDPRSLLNAVIKAAQHRGVDLVSGSAVTGILTDKDGRAAGVQTERTSYSAGTVVNCAGAWAGSVGPYSFPVHPVKGQMLAVVHGPALRHVIRGDDVYVVPRADGRLVIGSTLENAGYDKRVDVNTIKRLFEAASAIVPGLAKSQQHEAWAGLRPATRDGLPILGTTAVPGYFVATGHYRDGIMLAPITAQVMTATILGRPASCDLSSFAPSRFPGKAA